MYNTDMPSRAELPTSGQLLRSTLIAIVSAIAILVAVVLPAEYAIDPTGIGRALGLAEMGEIKAQLAEEARQDRERDAAPPARPQQGSSLLDGLLSTFVIRTAAAQAPVRNDQMTVTLKPGEGTEVKLVMKQGAKANYVWEVAGGTVNFDMHADGGGKSISYEKGRSMPAGKGVLEAAFAGNHGWFWRNRGKADVTVTLRVQGDYSEIKRQ